MSEMTVSKILHSLFYADEVFLKTGLKPIEGEDNRYQFMRKTAGESLWRLLATISRLQKAGIISEETCSEIKEKCCSQLVEEFAALCPPATGEYRFAGINKCGDMPMLSIVETDDTFDIEKHIAYCNGSAVMGTYRALLAKLDKHMHLTSYEEDGQECGIETEMWTDGGVDMPAFLDFRWSRDTRCSPYELTSQFRRMVNDFDIDEEVTVHREDKAYRDAFAISDSVRDFESYHAELESYACALETILAAAEQHHGLTRELCEGVFFNIKALIDGLQD